MKNSNKAVRGTHAVRVGGRYLLLAKHPMTNLSSYLSPGGRLVHRAEEKEKYEAPFVSSPFLGFLSYIDLTLSFSCL